MPRKKPSQRDQEIAEFRRNFVLEIGRCEICGHDPSRAKKGFLGWALAPHEIARGVHRQKALDKRFALLCVCWRCHHTRIHNGKEHWPEERQLAVLKRSRPEDFDLPAYCKLKNRAETAITEEDVAKYANQTD